MKDGSPRLCFLHAVFVVPPLDPLGGIEAEWSRKVPVKTGTTNGATTLVKHVLQKS